MNAGEIGDVGEGAGTASMGSSSVVAQAVAQTRQEMPGILEVLKAGKFQVLFVLSR